MVKIFLVWSKIFRVWLLSSRPSSVSANIFVDECRRFSLICITEIHFISLRHLIEILSDAVFLAIPKRVVIGEGKATQEAPFCCIRREICIGVAAGCNRFSDISSPRPFADHSVLDCILHMVSDDQFSVRVELEQGEYECSWYFVVVLSLKTWREKNRSLVRSSQLPRHLRQHCSSVCQRKRRRSIFQVADSVVCRWPRRQTVLSVNMSWISDRRRTRRE